MKKPRYFAFWLKGRLFKVDGEDTGYLGAEMKIWSGLGRHLNYSEEFNRGSLYSRQDCHYGINWEFEYDSKEEYDASPRPEVTGEETQEQAFKMLRGGK